MSRSSESGHGSSDRMLDVGNQKRTHGLRTQNNLVESSFMKLEIMPSPEDATARSSTIIRKSGKISGPIYCRSRCSIGVEYRRQVALLSAFFIAALTFHKTKAQAQ